MIVYGVRITTVESREHWKREFAKNFQLLKLGRKLPRALPVCSEEQ